MPTHTFEPCLLDMLFKSQIKIKSYQVQCLVTSTMPICTFEPCPSDMLFKSQIKIKSYQVQCLVTSTMPTYTFEHCPSDMLFKSLIIKSNHGQIQPSFCQSTLRILLAIANFQFSFYDLGANFNLSQIKYTITQISSDKTMTGPAS